MSKSHRAAKVIQAYQQFPWANIEPSLTLSGLLGARFGDQRSVWSRVLAGTDEQIASFIETLIPLHPINFNCPPEAATGLAWYLVPQIERVLSSGVTREETWAWYAAWRQASA